MQPTPRHAAPPKTHVRQTLFSVVPIEERHWHNSSRAFHPVYDIPISKSKNIGVSFVVSARHADRFLIALDSTTIYLLEVTLYYNKGQRISFTKETWMDTENQYLTACGVTSES